MTSKVEHLSLEDEIRRLAAEVRRLERRHGRSSASMLEAVRSGEANATGDICDWLSVYDNLKALEATVGAEGVSRTLSPA